MEDKRKLALSLAIVFLLNMLIIYMIQSRPLSSTSNGAAHSISAGIHEIIPYKTH